MAPGREDPTSTHDFAEAERRILEERLQQAEADAEAAREELRSIVYSVSHDVKESLRSVSSYAQLLVRLHPDDPESAEFGSYIMQGIRSAETFVNQLNAYSRIGSSLRPTFLALTPVLQMALMKLAPAIKDSGAEITQAELPQASVDETQFAIVFENLIDNAIRYRGTQSPHIHVSGEESDQGVLISVRDNGPGIESQYHEAIFQPFKKLHPKNISGVGLGLAACRKIVRGHQGRIWVESDGKSGSNFRILLPY